MRPVPWYHKPLFWLAGRQAPAYYQEPRRREFAAAKSSTLRAGWLSRQVSINSEIRRGGPALRNRSRDLTKNNEYAKRFMAMVKTNIVGPDGIRLQVRARNPEKGDLDRDANERIEEAWRGQNRSGQWDVTGKLSGADGDRLAIESIARDGELGIRILRRFRGNRTGWAVQYVPSDYLDHELNIERDPATGRRVIMGVEVDAWFRPVAYHLRRKHPGDTIFPGQESRFPTERVPASDLVWPFVPFEPEQTRGVPWMHAAMLALNDLGGYREAAIIASRVGAAKVGFYASEGGGDFEGDDEDEAGNLITEVEPGMFEQLPAGTKLESWDPEYPHEQFEPFNKAMLRGIASAFGVNYNSFANDLESTSYSSYRGGAQDERDCWSVLQDWYAGAVKDWLFSDWLRYVLLTQHVALPLSKFEKFNRPQWQPRRWPAVDPLKDAAAVEKLITFGVKSRSQHIREQGHDPDDVFREIAEERRKMIELGIPANMSGDATPTQPDPPGKQGEED